MLQDIITDEKRIRFWKILFKLSVFCLIMLANQKLLFRIFYFPAQLWYAYFGEQASYDAVYFLNWLVSDISSYLVPALAAFFLFRSERLPIPRQDSFNPITELPLVFFSTCFLGSLASMLAHRISQILDSLFSTGEIPDAMAGSLPSEGQSGSAWIFFLFVVVLAPVCEELIFRKLLLQPLRQGGDMFAVMVSALIFGAYHGNFDQFPYAFVVGLLYGILAVRSSSMLPTLLLHFINNLLVSAGSYLTDMVDAPWAAQVQSLAARLAGLAFWLGIPAVVLMVLLRLFRSPREEELTVKEKARECFRNPAIYVIAASVVLMLV